MKILVSLALVLLAIQPCFGADSFAAYQIGAKEEQPWRLFRDFFKEKGYDVVLQPAEATLEKHIEKVAKINKGPAKFLLGMEFVFGDDAGALIAMTDQKGAGAGSLARSVSAIYFASIDELPGKYVSDSRRLADAVAASFNVKVKHVPLFSLLGLDMPGIFLRIECKQDKAREMLGLLHASIQNYLRRDVSHER